MKPFKTHQGIIATLDRSNVDTDQIIPKQFLKSIKRTGFGENLFYDWRYQADGSLNPNFELNKLEGKKASILVTRNNFGCGSSREHAVWAIAQYGFRVLIAPWKSHGKERIPGFADIFKNNCLKNSILTIELSETEVDAIFEASKHTQGLKATAQIQEGCLTLHSKNEMSFQFELDAAAKERLASGIDDIGLTLKEENAISKFESKHNTQRD